MNLLRNREPGMGKKGLKTEQLKANRATAGIQHFLRLVTEDEERYILATIDPLSAMATADAAALDALLSSVNSGEAAVQAMLGKLAADEGLYKLDPMAEWQGMPEFEQDDAQGLIIRVHFHTEEDRQEFALKLGLTITDKTNSLWYPARPDELKDQLGKNLRYTDES